MSASKVVNSGARQRTGGRSTPSLPSQEQNPNQPAMASAAASRSLETDAVPVPEVPQQPKCGYRTEIFDKPEEQQRFSCGFCEKILREPMQGDCGHRFCLNCQKAVQEAIKSGRRELCKHCKEEDMTDEESVVLPDKMFPDRGFKREMMNLRTKCPNDMCTWHGPFKEYVKHEEECQHQPLVCEKCKEHVSKQKMDQHKARDCSKRIVKCDHCQADIVFDQKKNHVKECPKFPESCSQCNKNVPRDKMKKHRSHDCPSRMVTCPLEGCSGPQPLSRFPQHIQKEKDLVRHLAWVLNRVNDLDETLVTHTEFPSGSQASVGAAHQGSERSVTLDSLKEKLDQQERQLQEYIRQGGASWAGGATAGSSSHGRGDMGQASGGADASATTERVNAMEFKVNSLEPILSVLHGEMNRCIGAIEALETKLLRETRTAEEFRQKMEQHESTITAFSTSQTQREAKMRELETRIISLGQDQPDGTMLWRIPNFSQVRKDAVANTITNIHSRPFYTGPLGYKMCVRLYPNGDGMGRGTHLSLFFSIMRSNHDALLPWPFKQKVYFMLIDQNLKKHIVDAFRSEPTSSSFQRPTSEMNIATGCPMFVQLNKLNQPGHGYLKDDTMYIRVVVETDGLDEHLKQFDPRSMPLQQQ